MPRGTCLAHYPAVVTAKARVSPPGCPVRARTDLTRFIGANRPPSRIGSGAGFRLKNALVGSPGKHRFHLGPQRGGVERLDDVVVDPGLLRGNDVFGL